MSKEEIENLWEKVINNVDDELSKQNLNPDFQRFLRKYTGIPRLLELVKKMRDKN